MSCQPGLASIMYSHWSVLWRCPGIALDSPWFSANGRHYQLIRTSTLNPIDSMPVLMSSSESVWRLIFFKRKRKKWINVEIEDVENNWIDCYRSSLEPYDSDQMAKEFILQFSGMALTVGQTLVFSFQDKKLLGLAVKSLEGKFINVLVLMWLYW